MNIILALLFALTLSTLVPLVTAEYDENGLDLDQIAVRILLKESKKHDPNAVCTEEETSILGKLLSNILIKEHDRNLRVGREQRMSYSCRKLCRNWSSDSHCIVAYPWCAYSRDLAEKHLEAEVEQHEPRLLGNKKHSIAANNKCGKMKKAIEDEIDTILSDFPAWVSVQCMNLLDKGYKIGCGIIEE